MKLLILALAAMLYFGLAVLRAAPAHAAQDGEEPKAFQAFALADLVARARSSGKAYLPFLDRDTLSTGLYRLKAGSRDGQGPHELDEVYYLIEGEATFRAGEEERRVGPGDVLFVAAGVEHRFLDIEQDLSILVFFSKQSTPPEQDD